MSIAEHEFGGVCTDLKLSVVEGYLKAFTTALRPKFRELCYIDAFAGTGERTLRYDAIEETLFDPATPERVERRKGSAKIALEIQPQFDRLIFIEKNPTHYAALEALKFSNPERKIQILNGEADREIELFLVDRSWKSARAVMFLDPYGMSVSWSTLERIRQTEAIDVWYLVSLSGIFRQAAKDKNALDSSKKAAITRMIGTDEWQSDWYLSDKRTDLFGEIDHRAQRTADVNSIEEYVTRRLSSLFPKVLKPLRLHNDQGVPMFSLFFLISNPDVKAIGLAERIAGHMLKAGRSSQVRPR